MLANLPPELEGLIVSDVGSRPPPRPVLWGRNLEAQKTEELNLDFESTEKEVIDEFESIPKLSLEDLARAAARRKKAGKGCPGKDAAGKDEAGKDEAGKDGDLPCDDR